ncbi:hypothetical protein [Nonomuraea typhae]|uniref:Cytochrome d ubiquinol oxidase subunit II n=1 Tax=Nonomuraea typhae TaxID=2603600 RepID=A0ABW7YK50_9ACTN
MTRHTAAAVLLGSAGLWCALIGVLNLLTISSLKLSQGIEDLTLGSVLKAFVTVVPIIEAALFTPGRPSGVLFLAGALICGTLAALMAVAAALVRRGRPQGSLLAALLGACLIGLSLLSSVEMVFSSLEHGGAWYLGSLAVLAGLAVLSYAAGLAAIPPHAGSGPAGAFTRWALTGAGLGLVVLVAWNYASYLLVDVLPDLYVLEPPPVVAALAVATAAGLVALGWAAGRRGGSKGVLVAGGLLVFPCCTLAAFLLSSFTTLLPALAAGALAAVPLLAGLARLVRDPVVVSADGAAPAAGAVPADRVAPAGGSAPTDGVVPADGVAPVDGRAPAVLIAASVWGGPVVTLLGVVGIDEARRIAHREALLKGADVAGEPGIGDMFLESAAGGLRAYAVLFAVAVAGLSLLARRVARRGGTPGNLVAVFAWGAFYLCILAFAVSVTPFVIGDSDENVNLAVLQGPGWYVPAVRTILACSAAALVTAAVLLARRPGAVSGRSWRRPAP